jgi:hypothetical protein
MSRKSHKDDYRSDSDKKEYSYYSSSDSEPPPKKEKKKEPKSQKGSIRIKDETPVPPPVVSTPKRVKLSQSKRLEVIANKRNGIEDPEYSAVQNPTTGSWRVSKRKTLLAPTTKVEATSAPPGHDILVTWMNMQQNQNEELKDELKRLGRKYEKIASKYEEKKTKTVPEESHPPPKARQEPPKIPAPPKPIPQPIQTPPKPVLRRGQYMRGTRLHVSDF